MDDIRGLLGFPPSGSPALDPAFLRYLEAAARRFPGFAPPFPPGAPDLDYLRYLESAGVRFPGFAPPAAPAGFKFDARLTVISGEPIPSSDSNGVPTIYLTPFQGNQVTLYNGREWETVQFTEVSAAVPDTRCTNYDLFLYLKNGRPEIEFSVWSLPDSGAITSISNAASPVVTVASHTLAVGDLVFIAGNSIIANNSLWRVSAQTATTFTIVNLDASAPGLPGGVGTGGTWTKPFTTTARVTPLTKKDGLRVSAYDPTRLHVGLARTSTSIQGRIPDTAQYRMLVNVFNAIQRPLAAPGGSFPYTYASTTARVWHNDLTNRLEVLSAFDYLTQVNSTLVIEDLSAFSQVGLDGITASAPISFLASGATVDIRTPSTPPYNVNLAEGFHYLYALEAAGGAGTMTVRSAYLSGSVWT